MADDKKDAPKPAAKPSGDKPAPSAAPGAARAELEKREGERRGGERREEGAKKTPATASERAMTRLGWGLTLLAVAILLFAIVGGVLLFSQMSVMRAELEQIQAANHQNDQALAAANRMAEAAKKSADAIPDVQRAYVFVDAGQTALPKTVTAASVARIAFRNYGKTPATIGGVVGRYYYSPAPPVRMALAKASVPTANAVAEGGLVGPYDIPLDANDQDLARAAKGDGTMIIQAVIGYVDLFGESHETGLCYAFDAKAGAFAPCGEAALTYHN